MAGVELELQDVLPAVLAGRGRPGQREEVGAVGDAADGAALHGGGVDLLVAQHAEQLAEALDLLLHRSEEHTSELQSLMRISYAVFCLKKKNNNQHLNTI